MSADGSDTPQEDEAFDVPSFDPLMRLNADLKASARLLGRTKVRALVDLYYQCQDVRKATADQRLSSKEGEPNRLADWLAQNWRLFESDIKKSMQEVVQHYRVGQWLEGIVGIGPVLAAGLMAHLDISQAPTAGHYWRYGGYDPTSRWLGKARGKEVVDDVLAEGARGKTSPGERLESAIPLVAARMGVRPQTLKTWATSKWDGTPQPLTAASLAAAAAKRPWNAKVKLLFWKCGDCFVKFSRHPRQYYGTVYLERKVYEEANNARLAYRDQAEASLAEKNYGKDTEARKWYEKGQLPPARIHLRCQRYAVKMFVSHLHHVTHLDVYGVPPPRPFALDLPGHSHWKAVPNFDLDDPWDAYPGASLKDMAA